MSGDPHRVRGLCNLRQCIVLQEENDIRDKIDTGHPILQYFIDRSVACVFLFDNDGQKVARPLGFPLHQVLACQSTPYFKHAVPHNDMHDDDRVPTDSDVDPGQFTGLHAQLGSAPEAKVHLNGTYTAHHLLRPLLYLLSDNLDRNGRPLIVCG